MFTCSIFPSMKITTTIDVCEFCVSQHRQIKNTNLNYISKSSVSDCARCWGSMCQQCVDHSTTACDKLLIDLPSYNLYLCGQCIHSELINGELVSICNKNIKTLKRVQAHRLQQSISNNFILSFDQLTHETRWRDHPIPTVEKTNNPYQKLTESNLVSRKIQWMVLWAVW
jgi:hypothetical protein